MKRYVWELLAIGLLSAFACIACGSAADSPLATDGDGTEAQENADHDTETEVVEAETEADPVAALYDDLRPNPGPTLHERLGVATHMDQGTGDDADRNFELATYKKMGGLRIREDFSWGAIEPTEGDWHFEGLDTQVALARANNVKMIALLDYGVGWAMSDGTPNSIDPAVFARFAGKVAEHFCADIKHYEVWNEENIARFWAPTPDPAHYGALLAAAYPAIKTACPDAQVLFGGLASMSTDAWMGKRWWFLDDMKTAYPGICSAFDLLALHPYTYAQAASPEQDYSLGKTLPMQSQPEMTRLAKEKLKALGCAEKPIWFTEMGWPSYDLSEDTVARFLARSVLLSQKDDVQGYFWYDFYDGEPITTGARPHENYFGLFGWPGDATTPRREKPAFKAYSALNTLLGQTGFARDLSPLLGLPNDVYTLAFADTDGTVTLALWDGRENPDGKLGDNLPNAPDTTSSLLLPLPPWTTTLTRYNQNGEKQETLSAPKSLPLTLTAEIQYLSLGSAPNR